MKKFDVLKTANGKNRKTYVDVEMISILRAIITMSHSKNSIQNIKW